MSLELSPESYLIRSYFMLLLMLVQQEKKRKISFCSWIVNKIIDKSTQHIILLWGNTINNRKLITSLIKKRLMTWINLYNNQRYSTFKTFHYIQVSLIQKLIVPTLYIHLIETSISVWKEFTKIAHLLISEHLSHLVCWVLPGVTHRTIGIPQQTDWLVLGTPCECRGLNSDLQLM